MDSKQRTVYVLQVERLASHLVKMDYTVKIVTRQIKDMCILQEEQWTSQVKVMELMLHILFRLTVAK